MFSPSHKMHTGYFISIDEVKSEGNRYFFFYSFPLFVSLFYSSLVSCFYSALSSSHHWSTGALLIVIMMDITSSGMQSYLLLLNRVIFIYSHPSKLILSHESNQVAMKKCSAVTRVKKRGRKIAVKFSWAHEMLGTLMLNERWQKIPSLLLLLVLPWN